MADFMKAYLKMAPVEGLYSNDPDDPGGETVYGVARVFWPKWSGWSIVDAAKKQPGFLHIVSDVRTALNEFLEK